MNNRTKAMVSAMFSASPRSGELSAEGYLAMIELGCTGIDDAAIQEAVRDASRGTIPNANPGWVVGYDVFNSYAAKLDERNKLVRDRMARPAIEAPKRDTGQDWRENITPERRAEIKAASAAILKKFARA